MAGLDESYEVVHKDDVYRVRRAALLQGTEKFMVLDLELLGNSEYLD